MAIALALHQLRRDPEAFRSLDKALEVFERLIKAEDNNLDYRVELARIWNLKGYIYDDERRGELAIEPYRRALLERRLIVDKSQGIDDYKIELCESLTNLGEVYVDLGRVPEGLTHYLEALQYRKDMSDAHAGVREYSLGLADALSTVAEICRHDGEPARAGEFYARSREVLEALLSAVPGDGLLRGRLASVLGREAGTVEDVGKRDEAVRGLEKALAMAESAFRSSPAAAPVRETLTDILWNLARLLRERGELEPATRLDRRRITLWTGSTAEELLTLAAKQAARANLIGYGLSPLSEAGDACDGSNGIRPPPRSPSPSPAAPVTCRISWPTPISGPCSPARRSRHSSAMKKFPGPIRQASLRPRTMSVQMY